MNKLFWIMLVGFLLPFTFGKCSATSEDQPPAGKISVASMTSDFKISPNTNLPQGSEFFNVSVASDPDNGFLITWINTYLVENTLYWNNYACRISQTGEALDAAAIYLGDSYWPYYCPNAVFAGGNWIVTCNQGGLLEYVGVQRLTSSGVVLDDPPVNICDSIGMASVLYPALATNGHEILCVMGAAGSGLYGVLFDPDLRIIKNRFPVYADKDGILKLSSDGTDFFLTFIDGTDVKLIVISSDGQIRSVQTVNPGALERRFFSSIDVLDHRAYVTYFEDPTYESMAFWSRRYSMAGEPTDPEAIRLGELVDFGNLLERYYWWMDAYLDIGSMNGRLYFFLPKSPGPGLLLHSFKSDLSAAYPPLSLDSQCRLQVEFGQNGYDNSYSFIRSAFLGNNVMTAWIDSRDGMARIYANLFRITEDR